MLGFDYLTEVLRYIISILPQYPYENTLFNASILSEMKNSIGIESVSKTAVWKMILLPYL